MQLLRIKIDQNENTANTKSRKSVFIYCGKYCNIIVCLDSISADSFCKHMWHDLALGMTWLMVPWKCRNIVVIRANDCNKYQPKSCTHDAGICIHNSRKRRGAFVDSYSYTHLLIGRSPLKLHIMQIYMSVRTLFLSSDISSTDIHFILQLCKSSGRPSLESFPIIL